MYIAMPYTVVTDEIWWDMAIWRFSKWRHLPSWMASPGLHGWSRLQTRFVACMFGPLTKSIWWSLLLGKFFFGICAVFLIIYKFYFNILWVWLENAYSIQNGFWEIWHPKYRALSLQPQKSTPCIQTHNVTCRSSKLVHRCGLAKEKSKKKI